MGEKENLENIEELESTELEDVLEISADEKYVELEVQKECIRLDQEIVLEDKTVLMDTNEFRDGFKKGAYIAGFFTALMNAGIGIKNSQEIILNQTTIDHNILSAKMSNEASIEISKNQAIVADKNQL